MSASMKLALGGLFLSIPLFLFSQNLNQFIQLLPDEDGLIFGINKNTTVQSLVSSQEGLYILTQKDGCYLLSGESMSDLKKLVVPNDRRDLFTGLIKEDATTYLWSNYRELLNLDDPSAERVSYIGEHFNKDVSVTAIDIDRYGRVFVATAYDGLFIFRKDEFGDYTDIPLRISTVDRQLPSNNINCLYRDEEDVLWVGTAAGVSTIRENIITNLSVPKEQIKPNWWQRLFGAAIEPKGFKQSIQAITSWGDCILLASTESLYKASRQHNELTKLYEYNLNSQLATPLENVTGMMVDIDGNIWLAGNQLVKYNLTQNQVSRVSENMPFRGRAFLTLTEDINTGSIWIGTERGGLYEYYEGHSTPVRSNVPPTSKF